MTIDPTDPEGFCLWVPILVSVWVLRRVTERISTWAKRCKGFLKLFCWIAAIVVIVIVFFVLVLITVLWWVYVCGEDVFGGGGE